MREFFHGWRRKVGCVTLVMALVVTIVWMRSLLREDFVTFPFGEHRHGIVTSNGELYWWYRNLNQTVFPRPPNGYVIEYWLLVLPLTLLSAYLLLWKPRKREARPADERATIDGAERA